jgi:hypothetical protein
MITRVRRHAREELRALSGEKDGEPVTYWTFRLTRRQSVDALDTRSRTA